MRRHLAFTGLIGPLLALAAILAARTHVAATPQATPAGAPAHQN